MRVLMTGSTGAIGMPLQEALLARGHSVVSVVHPKPGRIVQEREGLQVVYGDVTDEGLYDVLKVHGPFDVLFHVAGKVQYYMEKREETLHNNVDGTRNMLKLAERFDIERVVYPSTCYVAGDKFFFLETDVGDPSRAHNPYEESKIHAEGLVRNYPGNPLIVRLSTVIGDLETGAVARQGGYSGFAGAIYAQRRRLLEYPNNPFLLGVNPHSSMNLVTREWAIKMLVNAGLSDLAGTIHVAHPHPVPMGWLFEQTFIEGFHLPVTYDRELWARTMLDKNVDATWAGHQEMLNARVQYFGSYVQRDSIYGHTRVRDVPGYTEPPLITKHVLERQLQYMRDVLFAPKQLRLVRQAA